MNSSVIKNILRFATFNIDPVGRIKSVNVFGNTFERVQPE